ISVGDKPTGCKYTPFSRNGSGGVPGSPAHPTHAASRPAMTGSMAVTSPPGLRCQPLTPSASTTRSTGRRFAATTRSNVVPATVMSRHLPARDSGPAYGPGLVSATSPQGNEAISQASLMSQRASWPRPALPGRLQSDSDATGTDSKIAWTGVRKVKDPGAAGAVVLVLQMLALSRRRLRPPGPRRAPRPPDSWRAPRSGYSPNPSACPRSARDRGYRRRAGRRRLPRREVPARAGPLRPRFPRVYPENPRALLLPKFLAAVSPRLRNPSLTSPVQYRRSSGSARPPPHAAWHRWRGRIRRPNAARSGTGGTHRRPRRQEMWILLTCQFTASVTSHTTLSVIPHTTLLRLARNGQDRKSPNLSCSRPRNTREPLHLW